MKKPSTIYMGQVIAASSALTEKQQEVIDKQDKLLTTIKALIGTDSPNLTPEQQAMMKIQMLSDILDEELPPVAF